jgi:phosphinothricin acetyltransferase
VRAADVTIRPLAFTDLDRVNAIYNHWVMHSTCTYQLEPDDRAAREHWFASHGARHALRAAVVDGEVVGWGALSPYRSRGGYARTVEDSLYLDPAWLRRGIGSALLTELIACGETLGHHAMIAAIDSGQEGSLRMHAAQGFVEVGRMPEVGFKFGQWLDVVYLQRPLGS